MRKMINKTQVRKLVESRVRRILKENYDDFDSYDTNDRDAEIGQSWKELEDLNKRFEINSQSANHQRLLPDFNHNIDDGREEAEAYTDDMYESKLRRMIRKALK